VAGSFSFYPTKNMTAGEGGMVTTGCDHIARQVRLLRNQGMERRYENEVIGFNTRMTDIHAAIGRVQLAKLAGWTAQRQHNAAFLSKNISGVITPPVADGAVHVYHQYTIRVVGLNRDAFADELTKNGVGNGVYYPTPIHRLPSFGLSLDLPVTEQVAKECLSLPVHPSLSQGDLEKIVTVVNDAARAGS
jgi:dTDP-4-amino-4,6-dideoxygalactose transaminase